MERSEVQERGAARETVTGLFDADPVGEHLAAARGCVIQAERLERTAGQLRSFAAVLRGRAEAMAEAEPLAGRG